MKTSERFKLHCWRDKDSNRRADVVDVCRDVIVSGSFEELAHLLLWMSGARAVASANENEIDPFFDEEDFERTCAWLDGDDVRNPPTVPLSNHKEG